MAAAPPKRKKFAKTARQDLACKLLKKHEMVLLEGGARSGKTFITIRQIIMRGLRFPSRHLACRFRFNHAKASLGRVTIPEVFRVCFPSIPFEHNKSEQIWTFPTIKGGESELWLGGIDDQDRMDKVLGNEFSTIFANEISQMSFDAIVLLQSRLAETSGLEQRFFLDQNPTVKSHWSYRLFHKGITPDREEVDWDTIFFQMNPMHNIENLDPKYIKRLMAFPKRMRQRFFEGLYIDAIEGALWTDGMINDAILRVPGQIERTIVAVDPSVSHTADSDECGIVVCSADDGHPEGGAIVHGDYSEKLPVEQWAQRAVDLYHEYDANCIVAEVNQGGDLVELAIHNIDPTIKVEKVHASKSKYARAEPISQLYQEGQIRVTHLDRFPELEEELTTYVPRDAKYSPNRLDALVWGLTWLVLGEADLFGIG